MSVDDAFDADVAVVGMAGRFPGARDVDAFWKNLREGVESIRPCSEEELQRAGVRGITRADPLFVNAGAVMDDPECFDAEFFGFARREAETMDRVGEDTEGQDPLRDESILIVDDCTLYRENLAATFALYGTAAPSVAWDLPSLVTALEDTTPSIVLLNIATRDSALLLRAAMEISQNVRVIVLGVSEDDESEIVACAEAGVAGYHMRTESLGDLLDLMRKIADGQSFCSPGVSAILLRRLSALASQRPPAANGLALTAREDQILRMLELGLSNQDIATQLCIAVPTVKNHVHSLLIKLDVNTRAEAAALCRTIHYTEGEHKN